MNNHELRKKVAEAIMVADEPEGNDYKDFSWSEAKAAMEAIADWIDEVNETDPRIFNLDDIFEFLTKELRGKGNMKNEKEYP